MSYKLIVFVPESHRDVVKAALFEQGAGKQGNYEHCCWEQLGTGQFKPLSGATPFIGSLQQIEQVPEYRIEMLCEEAVLPAVIAALKAAHPYEEPAYDVIARLAY